MGRKELDFALCWEARSCSWAALLIQVPFLYLTQMARAWINISNRKMKCSASLWPQQLVTALITCCASLEGSAVKHLPASPSCCSRPLSVQGWLCSMLPPGLSAPCSPGITAGRWGERERRKKTQMSLPISPAQARSVSSVLAYLHGTSWVCVGGSYCRNIYFVYVKILWDIKWWSKMEQFLLLTTVVNLILVISCEMISKSVGSCLSDSK